jgi:murein DD-endopeptidase MepM/ murein hydrolase activator NlpD
MRARRVHRAIHPLAVAVIAALLLVLPAAAAARPPDVAGSAAGIPASPTGGGAGAPRWPWPIAPPIVVGGSFVAPATPYAAGHRGIDLTLGRAVEVRAPANGVVTFSGVVVDRPVVTLAVGDELMVSFEPLESTVARDQRVARGQVIGQVAEGGHCGATCLHVGVRFRGAYVSPLLFFDRVPRAVLLPLD